MLACDLVCICVAFICGWCLIYSSILTVLSLHFTWQAAVSVMAALLRCTVFMLFLSVVTTG